MAPALKQRTSRHRASTFVGSLQSNKAREGGLACSTPSIRVDGPSLAGALAKEIRKPGRKTDAVRRVIPAPSAEVRRAPEENRRVSRPTAVTATIWRIAGLMCIPRPMSRRRRFCAHRKDCARNGLLLLSME